MLDLNLRLLQPKCRPRKSHSSWLNLPQKNTTQRTINCCNIHEQKKGTTFFLIFPHLLCLVSQTFFMVQSKRNLEEKTFDSYCKQLPGLDHFLIGKTSLRCIFKTGSRRLALEGCYCTLGRVFPAPETACKEAIKGITSQQPKLLYMLCTMQSSN